MIYAECKTEEALALLFHTPRDVIHVGGKTRVLKRLERQEHSKGLIDEDPTRPQPPTLSRYIKEKECGEEGIGILYDRRKENRLIILCPRLEEWILKAVKDSELDLDDYGLPSDPNHLHEIVHINLQKFVMLVKELLRRGNKRIEVLAKSLRNP